MRRYVSQRDGFRCGPYAMLNMLKWSGINEVLGQSVNDNLAKGYLSKICKCSRAFGTYDNDFWHGLIQLRKDTNRAFEFVKLRDVVYYHLRYLLSHGHSLIATYRADPWNKDKNYFGHWYFVAGVVGSNRPQALCINYAQSATIKYIDWFDTWIPMNEKSDYFRESYEDRYYFLIKSKGTIDDLKVNLNI